MNLPIAPSIPLRTRAIRTFARLAFTSCLTIALSAVAQNRQQDFSKVEIKTTPLSGTVHLVEGAGGNTGISVGPDGIFLVDSQFRPLSEKIEAALAKLNTNGVKYVVNTHVHGDHTGGNAYFGHKAKVVAHANLRKRLAEKKGVETQELPVITYENELRFQFNGEEIRVIGFTPGHTDGDTAVYFTNAKVLQLGDQFVKGRFPFIDVVNGGDVKGLIRNLDSLLAWVPADAQVIPGHGPVSKVEDLKRFRDTVAETVALVEQGIAEGKTSEQIRAAAALEKYTDWSAGAQNAPRWFDAVYNSLTKK